MTISHLRPQFGCTNSFSYLTCAQRPPCNVRQKVFCRPQVYILPDGTTVSLMEHIGNQPQKIIMVATHGKILQMKKKDDIMSLKDIILNSFGLVLI